MWQEAEFKTLCSPVRIGPRKYVFLVCSQEDCIVIVKPQTMANIAVSQRSSYRPFSYDWDGDVNSILHIVHRLCSGALNLCTNLDCANSCVQTIVPKESQMSWIYQLRRWKKNTVCEIKRDRGRERANAMKSTNPFFSLCSYPVLCVGLKMNCSKQKRL